MADNAVPASAERKLLLDLWHFIEDVPDDARSRQANFFALRERVRSLQQLPAQTEETIAGAALLIDRLLGELEQRCAGTMEHPDFVNEVTDSLNALLGCNSAETIPDQLDQVLIERYHQRKENAADAEGR